MKSDILRQIDCWAMQSAVKKQSQYQMKINQGMCGVTSIVVNEFHENIALNSRERESFISPFIHYTITILITKKKIQKTNGQEA